MSLPRPASITHLHLLSVLATELQGKKGELRILDAGCGDGRLMSYLQSCLPQLLPGAHVEVYGFDVADHGVQKSNFFAATQKTLAADHPDVDWSRRLQLQGYRDPWGYEADRFDAVISNQVLEHVNDHDLFFSSLSRVLKTGGISPHLFPLKHYWFEGHIYLPFVHWIENHDLLRSYIRSLSRIGLGKFPAMHRESGVSLEEYSERHADYMLHFTNYISCSQALGLGKRHGLRPSFRYTQEFYIQKLRSLLRLAPRQVYSKAARSATLDRMATALLCRLSCITLFFEKNCRYGQVDQSHQDVAARAA